MKRKIVSIALTIAMTAAVLAGCGSSSSTTTSSSGSSGSGSGTTQAAASLTPVSKDDIKVGVIYIGDENEGYTKSHMDGIQEMKDSIGLSDDQIIEKTGIPEDESCYDAAVDLADQGCNIIFATSFGHEDYLFQAAAEYPDIQFCHATGTKAATTGLTNTHNYFTNIAEARYVAGVVAGMKLNEMIADGTITEDTAKMGYVGAFPYAEVISGFTSFYLGAKSVCPSVTMEVQYTSSWADMSKEAETAKKLIADDCVLISQHADTTGAPSACQEAGVPCVGYNVDMISVAPDTALTSPTNNWGPYYTEAVQDVIDGKAIPTDWCKGLSDGACRITELNDKTVAEGTADKVDEVEKAIGDGSTHVFDTSTFTVNGSSLEDLIANDSDYAQYSEYVSDGYFHEGEVRSAPAFDIIIDGIDSQTDAN